VVADARQQRVAATGDQAEEGRLERVGLEEVGGDVTLQMVDRDQRQATGSGNCLGRADPDQERPDQARPGGGGNGVDLVQRHPRLPQRRLDHRRGQLQVVTRRHLRHHSPEPLVGGGLGGDQVAEDPRAVEDGGAGVVATRLYRQQQDGYLSRAT
jgi:hypothetical protein